MIRLFALLAGFVALATSSAWAQQPARFVPTLDAGDAIPPIPLVAQDDRTFTLAGLRGNAVLVSFLYTRCGDARMCPLVAAKFARIAHTIGDAPIRLVAITLDPAFDTPAVLRRYGHAFGQDPRYWTLATGSAASTGELAARLGIATSRTQPGLVLHTEAAVIVAPDGRIARIIPGNEWSPADLLAAARATLPGGSDRFMPLRAWLATALERCGGGLGVGGGAMLAIFGIVLATVGYAFWLAFGKEPAAR